MAHNDFFSYQTLWIIRSMSMLHYIASNLTSEIITNQSNSLFSIIVITILDFVYIWCYVDCRKYGSY